MSNCDWENIKEPIEYRPIITDTAAEDPNGFIITTVASMTAKMFFGLRAVGLEQHNALLTTTSLV